MKFWAVTVGLLGVLGIIGFVFLSNLHGADIVTSSQKAKALNNLLGRAPVLTETSHTTWLPYTSPVISFTYPSWARVYTADNINAKKNPIILDSFHFGLLDEQVSGIITVTHRPDFSQISQEPAVSLRSQNTSYTQIGTNSATIAEFINTDSTERSLFMLKNGNLYALIISGGDDADNKQIFNEIYSSLVFK